MPRHPRVHAEGLLYHLMARGNNGQKYESVKPWETRRQVADRVNLGKSDTISVLLSLLSNPQCVQLGLESTPINHRRC
jgi:hypothetical protein